MACCRRNLYPRNRFPRSRDQMRFSAAVCSRLNLRDRSTEIESRLRYRMVVDERLDANALNNVMGNSRPSPQPSPLRGEGEQDPLPIGERGNRTLSLSGGGGLLAWFGADLDLLAGRFKALGADLQIHPRLIDCLQSILE